MNKQPNWLPTQPLSLAVAEAAFGAGPVRAMINDGMVDVHWLDDGSAVLDWSDLHAAARIFKRWGTKRKDARVAAVNVVSHAEWLAALLVEHEQEVRERIKAEAKEARRTAVQRSYRAAKEAAVQVTANSGATVSLADLVAEIGEAS